MASDQTPEQYMGYAERGELGTGVFLQLLAAGGTDVTFKPSLTYRQCRTYGIDYQAFKWIPEAIAKFAEVQSDTCPVRGEECFPDCAAKGCLCNHTTNSCVDATGNASGSPPSGNQSDSGQDARDQVERKRREEEEESRRRKKREPAFVGSKW